MFKKYLPKIYLKLNKIIRFKNYSILYNIEGLYHLPFATNIHQILFGAIYAHKNNSNFYFEGSELINKFSIIHNKFSNNFKFFKKRYRFYYFNRPESNFFKRKDYFNNLENDFPISEYELDFYKKNIHNYAKNILFEKLKFYKDIEIDKDTLVIHIRSGDIFYNDWHSLYVQNPISFYLKIVKNYKKVIVVTNEIENNLILKELDKHIDFKLCSGKLEDDINILLNAKNLATSGVSAFPIACALMSQKLEKLIFSNIYLDEHLNPEMINEKFVEKFEYKIKNYIEIGKFTKSSLNEEKIFSVDQNLVEKIN